MLVWSIFSSFKVNQEKVNSSFMQVQCESLQYMVFYDSTVE